jgi:hypothetical protein|tara:strand:- start:313 stop:582 length:270 start_codon:yes stop_codon:yes gene_type:complete
MANYPNLPSYIPSRENIERVYNEIVSWANQLAQELDLRDNQVDNRPATKVYSVVTVTEIGRPNPGDIAFSLGEEKFKGYVSSTGWVNLN